MNFFIKVKAKDFIIFVKDNKGQAFVEFVIVIPVYMVFLLCFFQLVLIMHAKLMVDYASYCAARAGVVSKADISFMKDAVSVALSPLVKRVSSVADIIPVIAMNSVCVLPNFCPIHPIQLYVLSNNGDLKTTDALSNLSQSEKNLKVRVEYDFPMIIPIANRIIYLLSKGFLGNESTLNPDYIYPSGAVPQTPSLLISSDCAMRITTLTTPST